MFLTCICDVKAESPKENIIYSLSQSDNKAISFMNSFYKWYKTKYKFLNSIPLVKMDDNPNIPYSMNYNSTERYLSVLKSSGFFSDTFISYYRNYFKKIDAMFKKTKQNDGPVDGLDYDFIMHSQEPESYLTDLNNLRLTVVNNLPNKVVIKVKSKYDLKSYQLFTLEKLNNRHLIGKIDFVSI